MEPNLPDTANQFRSDLLSWAESNLRDYPWRSPERSLYEVFVAEFFLTQTPADNVARVYPNFLDRFPSLRHIRGSNLEDLEETIKPLGFQSMRSEALLQIAAEYDELPCEPNEMVDLPRVGPYVANTTLSVACNRALPILDRNVERIYRRVFNDHFSEGENTKMEFVTQMLPDEGTVARSYNLALVDFGALVCEKRKPRCDICFATDYCDYYESEVS